MILPHSKTLKVSTTEHQGSEIVIDGFEERLCGGKMQVGT
jgi:hypothetical protein